MTCPNCRRKTRWYRMRLMLLWACTENKQWRYLTLNCGCGR